MLDLVRRRPRDRGYRSIVEPPSEAPEGRAICSGAAGAFVLKLVLEARDAFLHLEEALA